MLPERTKQVFRLLLPPILLPAARAVLARLSPRRASPPALNTRFEYAPDGWDQVLPGAVTGWNTTGVVREEERKWAAFCANAAGSKPLGFSHEAKDLSVVRHVAAHNVHITFAYVLALAARRRERLSVLDWGGALGHYHVIARAVVPDLDVEYHCREVPAMVERGRVLNPSVIWHDDDGCLAGTYDLVMVNGVLQCLRDWRSLLPQMANAVAAGGWLLLTRVSVVAGPSFVAVDRIYGSAMHHQQFNEAELLAAVADTGLSLVRELVVGDRLTIMNAPESSELRGWLFRKGVP